MKLIFFTVLVVLIYLSEDNIDMFNFSNYIQDTDHKVKSDKILNEIFVEKKSKQWLHLEYFSLFVDFSLIYLNYWMFNNSFKSHENILFYIVHITHKLGLFTKVITFLLNKDSTFAL